MHQNSARVVPGKGHLWRRLLDRDRQALVGPLGLCGWVLAGGVALFATWELGSFSVLLGNEPLRPAGVHESSHPGVFRPQGATGCTQAPINRSSGLTTPVDCPAHALNAETLTARLSEPASPQ